MSKAAINAYARSNSGASVSSLLNRISTERQSEARRSKRRSDLIKSVGGGLATAGGAFDDFSEAKAGDYKGTFFDFLTASPEELSLSIELGKSRGLSQPKSKDRGGLFGLFKRLEPTPQDIQDDPIIGSLEEDTLEGNV